MFYGPPFPLRDHAGNDLLYPETPESSGSFWSPSPSESESSREATPSAEGSSSAGAPQKIISVILRGHEGVPSDHLFSISPKQVVSGWGWELRGASPKQGWGGGRLSSAEAAVSARWSLRGATAPSTSPSHPWCWALASCTRWSVLAMPWAS